MCGNQGQWEYSAAYNESLADGCTETAMCAAPVQVSWDWPRLVNRPVNWTSQIFAVTGESNVKFREFPLTALLD